ncbi:MAG: hypothetical protein KGJ10_03250 [Acidobacteriota bacterium]|nr:hypothetical protein [Acidobacteriota bacterium]MDE3223043.1 hypothetical protein [Acidobacteriota bacterium]
MNEQSQARRDLETSLRSLLPRSTKISSSMNDARSSVAAAGVGGLFTGYLYGRWQARRARRRKRSA